MKAEVEFSAIHVGFEVLSYFGICLTRSVPRSIERQFQTVALKEDRSVETNLNSVASGQNLSVWRRIDNDFQRPAVIFAVFVHVPAPSIESGAETKLMGSSLAGRLVGPPAGNLLLP